MDSSLTFFSSENQDVTKNNGQTCQLQGKCFALLTAFANSPMLLISHDGILVDINPRGCQLFEQRRDNLIENRLSEIWPGHQLVDSLLSGLSDPLPKPAVVEFTTSSGRQKAAWLEMHRCLKGCEEKPCSIATFFDVTLFRKREEALERTLSNRLEASSVLVASVESKYQSIVEASPSWVSLISPEGQIFVINRSGANILGVSAPEVLGISLWSYFSESETLRLRNCLGKAIEERAKIAVETVLDKVTCHKFLDVVFNPLIDNDGGVTRIVMIVEDITPRRCAEIELKKTLETLEDKVRERTQQLEMINLELAGEIAVRQQYQEQLQAAKIAAEAANYAKSDFLANMSHEIRTPMNSVLGFTNLLLNTGLNERQHDFAMTVKSSGSLLLALIDDILDLSKIEACKLELELLPFSFAQVLSEVVKLFLPKANEKNLDLSLKIDDVFDNNDVVGDKQRIRQVLINLIGNAVKFTRKGLVRVKASGRVVPGNLFFADVVVEDSGIGIEQKDVARVFGKFTQASSSTTRTFGGSGLGLAISKSLIELMGGTIGVCSTPGQGSEFFFHLPLQLVDHEHKPLAAVSDGKNFEQKFQKELRKMKILIVDDDAASRRLFEECIDDTGHSFVSVQSGFEAVERLSDEVFDLLIMDWILPESSGLQIIKRLRQDSGANQHVPVISVTARAMKGDREKCLEAGANFYLSKPFDPDELVRMIRSILYTD
ncbi:MAG: response regulator [Candidatus Riflebacteria bacterium]|nr:response regulator [Candidatus Riflebacteria bacterium]